MVQPYMEYNLGDTKTYDELVTNNNSNTFSYRGIIYQLVGDPEMHDILEMLHWQGARNFLECVSPAWS